MRARRVGALIATVLLALAVGALTRVPYRAADAADGGILRLSWRMRVDPTEHCRTPTGEELARLPAHMRREEICERAIPPHTLRLWVDGEAILERRVRAAGARSDRPLYVLEEVLLEPGTHRIRIRFEPEDETEEWEEDEAGEEAEEEAEGEDGEDDEEEDEEQGGEEDEGTRERGAPLLLDRDITVEAGEIVVVTTGDGATLRVLRREEER